MKAVRMSKRPRWKPVVALAAVLFVGVVVSCLFVGKTRERKEFVGNVDSRSGYRCRFTLSSSWRVSAKDRNTSPGVLDDTVFKPAPRSPIREWIDRALLHRQTIGQPMISLTTLTAKDTVNFPDFKFQAGYPEMTSGRMQHIFTQRRLWIDGCPATVVTFGSASLRSPPHTFLIVSVPDRSLIFTILDVSVQSEDMNSEMQAIISSFHIERVAVGAGGKR